MIPMKRPANAREACAQQMNSDENRGLPRRAGDLISSRAAHAAEGQPVLLRGAAQNGFQWKSSHQLIVERPGPECRQLGLWRRRNDDERRRRRRRFGFWLWLDSAAGVDPALDLAGMSADLGGGFQICYVHQFPL